MQCCTGFVLFNTQLSQAITQINFKYRSQGCVLFFFFRVEEYFASSRDKFIVDLGPNQIYTKHKAREYAILLPGPSSQNDAAPRVKYPTTSCGKALEKLPLFTKAEMKKHVENSGKRIGNAEHHSVPTSLKRAKTFLQDEYLKEIEAADDQDYFYFKCKCYHSSKKHEAPCAVQVALCIISGQVIDATCTLVLQVKWVIVITH